MIYKIKENIADKRISIIGAGISGIGACHLAKKLNAKVFLSDIKNTHNIKKQLIKNNIKHELGGHTKKCLEADLVILSPGININNNEVLKRFNDLNIPIISEIEFASWFTKNPIIAITGSNGKSTVVKLLYEIFIKEYPNTLLGGNIGTSFSENVLYEINNKKNKNIIHILEISSFQLEKIVTFSPKIACILNITSDHLDRYKNIDEYFKTKLNITKNYSSDSYIIFDSKNKKLFNYYNNFNNSIPISSIKIKKYISKNNLMGKHNKENLKACIAISNIFDISCKNLKSSISNFTPLEHRMEIFKKINGITFINDSKGTNIFSTKAAINSFDKNIILILGGSKSDIDEKHFIEIINKNSISYIICYGEIGKDLLLLYQNLVPTTYHKLFKDAIIDSIKKAQNGDTVLLSPAFKSYDQFENFEKRGMNFKEIVNNYYA